jgi:hypothetical protein
LDIIQKQKGTHPEYVFISKNGKKIPGTTCAVPNPKALLASACPIAAILQPVNAPAYSTFDPMISITLSITTKPIALAAVNAIQLYPSLCLDYAGYGYLFRSSLLGLIIISYLFLLDTKINYSWFNLPSIF